MKIGCSWAGWPVSNNFTKRQLEVGVGNCRAASPDCGRVQALSPQQPAHRPTLSMPLSKITLISWTAR